MQGERPPWVSELRFQEVRRGCWLQGKGKRLEKSNVGLEALPPGLTKTLPTQSQGGGELAGAQTPGARTRQRAEAAEWCQIVDRANLVKSGSGDGRGSRKGPAQDSALRMLSSMIKTVLPTTTSI